MPPKQRDAPLPSASSASAKRSLPESSKTSPAKKQSKWSAEEDAKIIELRGKGMKWDDISRELPGRSAISCRLHYQNYLERRSEWDEDRKDRLARLYERFKSEMWAKVAQEMEMPWRAVEAMHWQLGEQDMARRAGVIPFSLSNFASDSPSKRPTVVAPTGPKGFGPGNSGPAIVPAVVPTMDPAVVPTAVPTAAPAASPSAPPALPAAAGPPQGESRAE